MWLSDLNIVQPDGILERGAVLIEEGRIAEIRDAPVENGAIRLHGLKLLPGIVDIHGDMFEREIHPRPSANIPHDMALYELDKKLAANGITTAYAAISFAWHKDDTMRSEDNARKLIAAVNEMKPSLLVDHYVHARFEITNPEAAEVLHDVVGKRQVHLVSVMDHTPGQGQYRDIEAYVKFSVEWSREKLGREITEDDARLHVERAQQRPKAWDAVEGLAKEAPKHGLILASHDDDSPERVDILADMGFDVSEFPVTMEAAEAARARGMHVVMGAPNALRGQSHSGNLSAIEAVSAGVVDTLATDYYPPAMLHAAYKVFRSNIMPLHEAAKLVSTNPADAMGLKDRGTIEAGKRADLVIVDDAACPRIRGTLCAGVPVFWDSFLSLRSGLHGNSALLKTDSEAKLPA